MGAEQLGEGRSVTVVGAGFSGLVSAYYLRKAGFAVVVLEERDSVGGLIQTIQHPLGPVETAANGLLNSVVVEDLFRDIGAQVLAPNKIARRRFVFRQGRPSRWPLGLVATLRVLFFVFRVILFRSSVAPRSRESVSQWGERVFGREATAYTLEAALQGIYAGDARRMSARLVFGRMFGIKDRLSALLPRLRGKPSVRGTVSVQGGMGELIRLLFKRLQEMGVVFKFGQSFASLNGETPGQPLVVATSAQRAALILSDVDRERTQALQAVEFLPVVTATVFYQEPIQSAYGFGCLFPPCENKRVLGVLMNSVIFAGKSHKGYSETWILGGARMKELNPKLLQMSDEEILSLIDEERNSCFGAQSQRLGYRITRWPQALPHYTTDLEKRMTLLQVPQKNIFLMGNYLGQIGLGKILELATILPKEVAEFGKWHQTISDAKQ